MRLRARTVMGVAAAATLVAGIPAMAASQAGKPTKEYALLCGTSQGPVDNFKGNSGVDHPTGLSASGGKNNDGEYDSSTTPFSSGQCDNQSSSGGAFTWAVDHANVRPNEQGTEHADASGTQLVVSGSYAVTFNGHITNYDFNGFGNDGSGPDQSGSREIYYQSGGPFNTEGGAQAGNHFRGSYTTVYYQLDDNDEIGGAVPDDTVPDNDKDDQCPKGGSTYCFEAILNGQVN